MKKIKDKKVKKKDKKDKTNSQDKNQKGKKLYLALGFLLVFSLFIVSAVDIYTTNPNATASIQSNVNFSLLTYNNTYLQFDGVNEFATITNTQSFQNGSYFAYGEKFNFSSFAGGRIFLLKGNYNYNPELGNGFYMKEPVGGNLQRIQCLVGDGASSFKSVISTTNLSLNTTYDALCVLNQTSFSVYINGLYDNSVSWSNISAIVPTVKFGGLSAVTGFTVNATISNVYLYNYTPTDLQISNQHQSVLNNNYTLNKTNVTSTIKYNDQIYIVNSTLMYTANSTNIMKSIDGGNTFSILYNDPYNDPSGFFITSKGTIILGYNEGNLSVSVNNDHNWTTINNPFVNSGYYLVAEWGITEDKYGNVYMGGYGGNYNQNSSYIYKSTNGINWDIVYNASALGLNGRHIHQVKYDSYNGCIYASQGDDPPRSMVLRSCDNGTTWVSIWNGTQNAQPTGIFFTSQYRIFSADGNSIWITSDDSTFTQVFSEPLGNSGWNWVTSYDSKDKYFIIGTVSDVIGDTPAIYISPDGFHWYGTEALGIAGDTYLGYIGLSGFDEKGYAYLQDNIDHTTYKFNINPVNTTLATTQLNLNENNGTIAYQIGLNGSNATLGNATVGFTPTWGNDGNVVSTISSTLLNLTLFGNTIVNPASPISLLYNYFIGLHKEPQFDSYIWINNTNATYTIPLQVYNLTNALIFNTNGSIINDSNINNNNGNINFTLNPLNSSYILNNFNLTEGVNRTNSPINISSITDSGTDRVYHIASGTTNSVIIPAYFNLGQGIVIHNITETLGNGTVVYPTYQYLGNGLIQITNLPLSFSSSSNQLDINYGASCTSGVNGVNALILIIVVLLPIITCIWMIVKREDLNMQKLVYGFLIISIEIALVGVVANSVATICT